MIDNIIFENIKKLSKNDLSKIDKIIKEEWSNEDWHKTGFVKNTIKFWWSILVARDISNNLLWILITWPNPSNWLNQWIYLLIVNKQNRWNNIGTRLVELWKNIYNELIVDVWIDDIDAYRFYIKNWFKKIGTVDKWFGDKWRVDNTIIMKFFKKVN